MAVDTTLNLNLNTTIIMIKTINSYIEVGFVKVGTMTKNVSLGKKKHNVYVDYIDYEPKGKKGVYIIAYGDTVMKIGESENLQHRFQCYESHSGSTNTSIRESMVEHKFYDIYFIECPHFTVGFAGVLVDSGISYKTVEKQLLRQFRELTGKVPVWNKGIQ